jgi:hypothetical protein
VKTILSVLLLSLVLVSCMNTYYNRFGGYPLSSETLKIDQDSIDIELLVTYRYFMQDEVVDSTSLNISVKPIIDKQNLSKLKIESIALASSDNSYLMTYSNPSIYDRKNKLPIFIGSTDKPCVFTVNRSIQDYDVIISYLVHTQNTTWERRKQHFPINIANPTRKIQENNEE